MEEAVYYVYRYYFKSTDETFYIGKGKNNRYKDTKSSRNEYFKNVIKNHLDDILVDLIYENLTDDEACNIERKLIHYYWSIGQCKCNFHEGGKGGYTGKYDSVERSKKLSAAASARTGEKNAMFGKTHSKETREKIRQANLGKHLSPDHKQALIQANTGRIKTPEEIEKIRLANIGKKMSKESYDKMMLTLCKDNIFDIIFKDEYICTCYGYTQLCKKCKELYNISVVIVMLIVKKSWIPKFKKHEYLKALKIERIHNSVSTNRDECNGVE